MEIFKIENLTFKYPTEERNALDSISLEIKKGEFLTVCGTSGCGKTTLLRLLKPSLSPEGEKSGAVLFDGENITEISNFTEAKSIGFVMQNPENQIVCDKVWHEMAFGAESLGMKQGELRVRVAEMASFFGIGDWFYKNVNELSGGQKQLLNLASVMVTAPSVLILDEPTSQLDPIAAQEFLSALCKINREIGTTVIISEHRLEETFAVSDRVLVMENGKTVFIGKPNEAADKLKKVNSPMLDALPTATRVFINAENSAQAPVTVKAGREWLSEYVKKKNITPIKNTDKISGNKTVITLDDVYFRYDKNSDDIIKSLSTEIKMGEIFAILGGNGSGKTTALSLISGINKPYRGKITLSEENIKIAMLPQNPRALFVEKTVYAELCEVLSDIKIPENKKEENICKMISLCRLENLTERHPYDLSGGEAQRVALAKVLLTNPDIILLDEPTKGIDANFKKKLAGILLELKNSGASVVIVSHDVEFCAEYADKCALFFDGSIVSENTPREFFGGKSFYTTAANRMSRGVIENAVLADDIIYALTGEKSEKKEDDYSPTLNLPRKQNKSEEKKAEHKKKFSKLPLLSVFVLMVLVPATILAGKYLFQDRKYYFISLLIILELSVSFFLSFEKRKPSAREIVLISSLAALTAAGRIMLFSFPQFKPMAALIIISGACLGAESGFLVGALSLFASNFFLSQGPWTPWQMFGFALIGFVSGCFSKSRVLPKKRIPMSVFGFFAVMLLYAPVVNFGNVMMTYSEPSRKLFKASMLTGVPFDFIHAASTAFFLFVAHPVIAEKLERIKIKYGLLKN